MGTWALPNDSALLTLVGYRAGFQDSENRALVKSQFLPQERANDIDCYYTIQRNIWKQNSMGPTENKTQEFVEGILVPKRNSL